MLYASLFAIKQAFNILMITLRHSQRRMNRLTNIPTTKHSLHIRYSFSALQEFNVKWTWMTVPQRKAPGNPAVLMEDSVWTVLAATRALALQDSLENTAREIWMSASLGPATPQEAWTVCSWSTITSAAAALDTLVHTYSLLSGRCHVHLFYILLLCNFLILLYLLLPRSSLWVNGGFVLIQAVPQRWNLLHEHELSTWLHMLLPSCKCLFCKPFHSCNKISWLQET